MAETPGALLSSTRALGLSLWTPGSQSSPPFWLPALKPPGHAGVHATKPGHLGAGLGHRCTTLGQQESLQEGPCWLKAWSLATQLQLGLGLFSSSPPVREPIGGVLGTSHPVSIMSGPRLFWSSHVTSHVPTLPHFAGTAWRKVRPPAGHAGSKCSCAAPGRRTHSQ